MLTFVGVKMTAAKKHVPIVKKRTLFPLARCHLKLLPNLWRRAIHEADWVERKRSPTLIRIAYRNGGIKKRTRLTIATYRHEALHPIPVRPLQACGRGMAQAQGY